MKTWIWRWGPAVALMSIIFIASATPGTDMPGFGIWDLFVKKGGHMLGYAMLAVAYFHALKKDQGPVRRQYILAFCLAVFYAATDEWHQRFVPGRSPSLGDVGIDASGAFVGLTLWHFVRMHFKPGSRR
jgi:VanZ family protein